MGCLPHPNFEQFKADQIWRDGFEIGGSPFASLLAPRRLTHLCINRVQQRFRELARKIAGDEHQTTVAIVRLPAIKEGGRAEHVLHTMNNHRSIRAFGDVVVIAKSRSVLLPGSSVGWVG